MSNFKEKYIVILLKLIAVPVFSLLFLLYAKGEAVWGATDIRVGLKALYSGRKIITVYNSELRMGYCLNDSFKADIELKSAGGFSFEPDSGKYFSDGKTYISYREAYEAAKSSSGKGKVCYTGRDEWRVYIEGSDGADRKSVTSSELVKMTFGNKVILLDANFSGGYPQFAAAKSSDPLSLGSRKYRGRIEVGRYGSGTLTAVNIVNIESYLLSVVSCEMNTEWHGEAQKAQAVCARSYCLANAGFGADSYLQKGYVIVDTTDSQVYAGVGKESDMSVYAVKSTVGQVLKVDGKVLPAYFFSTSGGATEFSTDVWGGNNSSFIGVFDEYEIYPERKPWCVKTTFDILEEKLKAQGYKVENISSIYPEIISDSGRVSSVRIKYPGGSISVKGSLFRSMFGLDSTKFRIVTKESDLFDVKVKTGDYVQSVETKELNIISGHGTVNKVGQGTDQLIVISEGNMTNFPLNTPGENEIWFLGMGWGHGIGMSQSGAYGMAIKGFTYDEILKFYYNNTEIGKY